MTPEERRLLIAARDALDEILEGSQAPQPLHPVQPVPYATAPVPVTGWTCPVHGQAVVVPAGFSNRTQRPYSAFVKCPEYGCQQRPPRNGPVRPVDGRTAVNYPEVAPVATRGLTDLP